MMMLYFKLKHTAHKPTLISEYIYISWMRCRADPTAAHAQRAQGLVLPGSVLHAVSKTADHRLLPREGPDATQVSRRHRRHQHYPLSQTG